MSHSIIIGNFVRGFHVISSFNTEQEALDFAAEYKREVGSEWRCAASETAEEFLQRYKQQVQEHQDVLLYEEAKPGELLTSTGLSIDIQPKEDEVNAADQPAAREDRSGAVETGDGSGGSGASLSGLHLPGESIPGAGQGQRDDQSIAGGASRKGAGLSYDAGS